MASTYAGTAQLTRFMGYTSTTNPFTSDQMQDALNRAETEINNRTKTVFVVGTATTPTYLQVVDEKRTGQGYNQLNYFLDNYPLPDITTTVQGTAVTGTATTIYVNSTQGFPSSGTIALETDKVAYTGKSGSAFTGCTGLSVAHGTAETVTSYVIEISTTDVGLTPSWNVLEVDRDYDLDLSSGRVRLFHSSLDVSSTTAISRFPAYQLPNRFRANYVHGWDEIPYDITRCELMIASQDLMHSAVRKAHSGGQNEFNPSMINVDQDWIDNTIDRYKSFRSTNI